MSYDVSGYGCTDVFVHSIVVVVRRIKDTRNMLAKPTKTSN
jgi:hypothetical protein